MSQPLVAVTMGDPAGIGSEIVARALAEPGAEAYAAFSFPRLSRFGGRWIRHGDWYPDRLVRLFRCKQARFVGSKVHERLELAGRVIPLQGDLHHYSFEDAADHRARGEKYARLWAGSRLEEGRTAGGFSGYFHAAFRWMRAYILRAGFLDGAQGWRIARLSAQEVVLKYRLLHELGKTRGTTLAAAQSAAKPPHKNRPPGRGAISAWRQRECSGAAGR